ncbi:unnamed protein product [Symbiodinium sp. CCMP2456]|nr:unnamed protein product [Symbiodinium sp. CCMP2456]
MAEARRCILKVLEVVAPGEAQAHAQQALVALQPETVSQPASSSSLHHTGCADPPPPNAHNTAAHLLHLIVDLAKAVEATGAHNSVEDLGGDLHEVARLLKEGTRQMHSRTRARNWGAVHRGEDFADQAEAAMEECLQNLQGLPNIPENLLENLASVALLCEAASNAHEEAWGTHREEEENLRRAAEHCSPQTKRRRVLKKEKGNQPQSHRPNLHNPPYQRKLLLYYLLKDHTTGNTNLANYQDQLKGGYYQTDRPQADLDLNQDYVDHLNFLYPYLPNQRYHQDYTLKDLATEYRNHGDYLDHLSYLYLDHLSYLYQDLPTQKHHQRYTLKDLTAEDTNPDNYHPLSRDSYQANRQPAAREPHKDVEPGNHNYHRDNLDHLNFLNYLDQPNQRKGHRRGLQQSDENHLSYLDYLNHRDTQNYLYQLDYLYRFNYKSNGGNSLYLNSPHRLPCLHSGDYRGPSSSCKGLRKAYYTCYRTGNLHDQALRDPRGLRTQHYKGYQDCRG